MDKKCFDEIKFSQQAATPGKFQVACYEDSKSFEITVDGKTIGTAKSISDAALFSHSKEYIAALIDEVGDLNEQHRCDVHNIKAMQTTLDQQAKNCEKLLADKDQQIATLRRALELACKDREKNSDCVCCINPDWYIHQAQEQEGKK